jgi:hypothetical protein
MMLLTDTKVLLVDDTVISAATKVFLADDMLLSAYTKVLSADTLTWCFPLL